MIRTMLKKLIQYLDMLTREIPKIPRIPFQILRVWRKICEKFTKVFCFPKQTNRVHFQHKAFGIATMREMRESNCVLYVGNMDRVGWNCDDFSFLTSALKLIQLRNSAYRRTDDQNSVDNVSISESVDELNNYALNKLHIMMPSFLKK